MFKLFGNLRDWVKGPDVHTDSAIFRLHNIFTAVLLLTCSLIITATQYVGKPIECIVNGLPTHPINTYCWITSTFTMPEALQRQVGNDVAHPGVANDFDNEDAKKYHSYYQWVCFVLFFQAILCYTPKYLWDVWEGGLMMSLKVDQLLLPEEEKTKCKKKLVRYLIQHIEHHTVYALRYFLCEFLCLINVIFQMYMMNKFFDGEFLSYGLRVMYFSEQDQEDRVDPMVYVFPRVTKCIFYKFGASGSIQKHDSLCLLPLNIVNEKTYIFIWFWFVILACLLTCLVLYRALLLSVPCLRPRVFRIWHWIVAPDIVETISRKTDVGDWWVLYMLGNNVEPLLFRDVVTELAKKIETALSNTRSRRDHAPLSRNHAPSSLDHTPL